MRGQYLPVGEDEAPVDQEQGEVVPSRGVGLGHVEQQPVAVVGSGESRVLEEKGIIVR